VSDIIEEQIRYYRGRAPEYDETADWRADPFEEQWHTLLAAFEAFRPSGRILEIAAGTGHWTKHLLRFSDDVTAIDASPEMIGIARKKLGNAPIRFVEADVFAWRPDGFYDTVFFANWLSHVLPDDLERFWGIVRSALAPDGRVFFVDEAQGAAGDAWRHEEFTEEAHVVTRRLRDGTAHRAVKVFWGAGELQDRMRALGWDLRVTATPALLYGEGRPAHPGTLPA
jgi:demethylmenaquinone methyltransferase/2-methoxy-6-polyprenyl-1,4-benzoquinol methylase